MAKQKVTISQGLNLKKTMQSRLSDLLTLRNENSNNENRHYANIEKVVEKKALYDVIALDTAIVALHRELRLLDDAMKNTNATTKIKGWEWDEAILGEVAAPKVA